MNPSTVERVQAYLWEQQEAMVDFLRRLALIETPSTVPEAQTEILTVLEVALQQLDYHVRILPGRDGGGHLYARPLRRARHRPLQLLLGHCDTVWPLGTLAAMPVSVAGGIMRGPGVFDMKGGLTQAVFALRALCELELDPPLTPMVFINSDEEIGSPRSTAMIARLARRAARCFVMEPALTQHGKLKTARKGVGRFTVNVWPDRQEDQSAVVLELSYVIQKLFDLNDPQRGVTVNVGLIDCRGEGPGLVPQGRAIVDVRVPSQVIASEVQSAILGLQPSTAGVLLHVEGAIRRPPLEPTARNQALWQQARALAQQMGLPLEEGMAGGGSDGNTTSQHTATLDGLGAVGDGAHAPHEFVSIDRMVERSCLLALLLLAPLGQ